MEKTAYITLTYNDDSMTGFEVKVDDSPASNQALLQMITRGTLMASMAKYAHCYDSEGFDICAYQK